jgi:hypothetical protein
LEELLAFSKHVLTDIPVAWAAASVDQKQRVQNALFPGGLKYHPEKEILNEGNASLYAQLESFLGGKVGMVRPNLNSLAQLIHAAKPLYVECGYILRGLAVSSADTKETI